MSAGILIEGLSKRYGRVQALKNLSFQVKKGECAGLLGTNGAGKSTVMSILTGQLRPCSGRALVLGIDPVFRSKDIHSFMGYVPDRQSVYDELTARQNIEVFRQLNKAPAGRTEEVIQQLQLSDKAGAKAGRLSRGQRQRLLIARALVHNPRVLLLDEPAAGLDPDAADFVCQILRELKRAGAAILLTTHSMSLAEKLCDSIILLSKGEKRGEGSLSDLRAKHGRLEIRVSLTAGGRQKSLSIPFKKGFLKELEKISGQGEITSIRSDEKSLEDIFLAMARRPKP